MGFWKSLGKGIDNFSTIMADAAEGLEESSRRMLMESRVSRLERRLERDLFATDTEKQQTMHELVDAYDDLLKLDGKTAPPSIASKKAALQIRLRASQSADLAADIKAFEALIKTKKYRLAIDNIRDLTDLLGRYKKLSAVADGDTKDKLAARTTVVRTRVNELELERTKILSQKYPSGNMRSQATYHDGKLSGPTTYWYEDGAIKLRAAFSQGLLHGEVEHWYPTGEIRFRGKYAAGKPDTTARSYCRNVQEVIELKVNGSAFTLSIWLWNGIYVGRLRYINGKVLGKIRLILRTLLNPLAIRAFYQVARGNGDQQGYKDFNGILDCMDFPIGASLGSLVLKEQDA